MSQARRGKEPGSAAWKLWGLRVCLLPSLSLDFLLVQWKARTSSCWVLDDRYTLGLLSQGQTHFLQPGGHSLLSAHFRTRELLWLLSLPKRTFPVLGQRVFMEREWGGGRESWPQFGWKGGPSFGLGQGMKP